MGHKLRVSASEAQKLDLQEGRTTPKMVPNGPKMVKKKQT